MIVFGITGVRRKSSLLLKGLLLLLLLLTLATLLINQVVATSVEVLEPLVQAEEGGAAGYPGEPVRVQYAADRYWQDMLEQSRLID